VVVLFFLVLPALRMGVDGGGAQTAQPLLEVKSLACSRVKAMVHVVGELGNLAPHRIMSVAVEMEFRLKNGSLADRSTTEIIPTTIEVDGTAGFKVYGRDYGRQHASTCHITRIFHFHNGRPIPFEESQLPPEAHDVAQEDDPTQADETNSRHSG
jgi:hypothetical protein